MNYAFYILPVLLAVSIPSAFAQVIEDDPLIWLNSTHIQTIEGEIYAPEIIDLGGLGVFENHTHIEKEDGKYLFAMHPAPYFEDYENHFVPYFVSEDDNILQVQFSGGKYVFDKNAGAVTIFDENGNIVINSDSYVVKSATVNSDVWNNLDVNNSPVITTFNDDGEKVTVTFTRENNEGIFEIEYILKLTGVKTTAYFTNQSLENQKISFTQTLNLDNELILNDQTILLSDYEGQTFPREILEQNQDLILAIKELKFNAGLGFEQLWAVNVHENGIVSLDYGNQNETAIMPGQTVELDPTWSFQSSSADYKPKQYLTATFTAVPNAVEIYYFSAGYQGTNGQGYAYGTWGPSSLQTRLGISASNACNDTTQSGGGSSYGGWTYYWDDHFCSVGTSGGTTPINAPDVLQGIKNGSLMMGGCSPCNTNTSYGYHYASVEYGVAVPPTAPQNLTTSQSVANEIILNYQAPSSNGGSPITNYEIFLNGSLIDTIGNVLTYTDTISGGEIGANLVYSVKAISAGGTGPASSNSNISSWDVPDQVTGLTAQTGSPIILNWNVPASDDTITNYEIKRDGSVIATVGAVTTYSDNAPSGGTYSFEISAISAVGQGAFSSSVSATAGLPWNVPTNLSATVSDVNATPLLINLSWDASTQGSGTGTLTGYELFVNGVSIGTVGTVTSSTHQLTNPGTFDFTIKSLSTHGDSATGNIVSVTTPSTPGSPSLTLAINDPNNLPLDITSTFIDGPTGGSAITGFNLYYSSDDVTYSSIVNNTNSDYTYSVSNSGTHYFKSEAINNVGTGTLSTAYSSTTPNVPDAITDLSGSVISDTQINVTWTAPNAQGSNIDLYKIFRDGSQIDTTTNTSYSLTGLTANTAYAITVYANNSVGDSLVSNTVNLTTYQPVNGSITVTPNTQGATTQLTFSASGITGTPTPTFSTFTLKEGVNVIASGISSPYTLTLNDNNSHTYTITSTDNTHWNTPTISGSTTVTASYDPNWSNGISYNFTRSGGVTDLTINRDTQNLWDATCNYRTTAQVMADQSGIVSNFTNVWYINDSQNIADTDTVYVSCSDDGTQLFAFTSFGPNRLGGGIAQLDAVFGEWTGTPVALIFVLLVAGLFTGRSAPTGILLVLALIGVLGFIGMLTIDEAVWGFLLLAGVLGIFLGKRFL